MRHVIEKLVAKNPAERYRTAGEALADLKSRLQLADSSSDEEETEEESAEAAKQQRRKRLLGMALGGAAELRGRAGLAGIQTGSHAGGRQTLG